LARSLELPAKASSSAGTASPTLVIRRRHLGNRNVIDSRIACDYCHAKTGAEDLTMARFMAKLNLPDGKCIDMPAKTCDECKGIGYVTKSVACESRTRVDGEFRIHRTDSGDRCPMCVGRGWMGVPGSEPQGSRP